MISIITTAYKNDKYIIYALNSMVDSAGELDFEILLGIDNCYSTLNKIKKEFINYEKILRIFFFDDKPGTYVIRNTLIKEAKYEKIIFFDSDDIMLKNMVSDVSINLDEFDAIRPMFKTFKKHIPTDLTPTLKYSYGAFAINKNVFLQLNGFEPWSCAADGEFWNRLDMNYLKIKYLETISFFYRRHPDSLTNTPESNMKSEQRKKYHEIRDEKKKNNDFGPLEKMIISNYRILDGKYDLSIIIPTYNTPDFLLECLDSIIKSIGDFSCQILVGIDNCELTKKVLKNLPIDERIEIFYFEKNIGPYIIKNTLSLKTNSDNLLFFDSDDLMIDIMVPQIIDYLKKYECVKPMYSEFESIDQIKNKDINEVTETWGEGVFAIKKNIFSEMKGFEGWRCAADSDFMKRLYKNNISFILTPKPLFYRRIHKNGLTSRPETNYTSELRRLYYELSNNKTFFGPLTELVVDKNYKHFDEVSIENDEKINDIIHEEILESSSITDNKKDITTNSSVSNLFNSILNREYSNIIVKNQTLNEKREYINTFSRFTPPKKTKRK